MDKETLLKKLDVPGAEPSFVELMFATGMQTPTEAFLLRAMLDALVTEGKILCRPGQIGGDRYSLARPRMHHEDCRCESCAKDAWYYDSEGKMVDGFDPSKPHPSTKICRCRKCLEMPSPSDMDTVDALGDRQEKALIMARNFAYVQTAQKKQWVIDQMVRALCGKHYDAWVKIYNDNDPKNLGPWDTGEAP